MLNKSKSKKSMPILDEKITEVNREINREFYDENEASDKDPNLYNMGDSTPILNDGHKK